VGPLAGEPGRADANASPAAPVRTPRLRDRLLSSPRFRAWAARFPLTRFVARRRASALFDLMAGFVYSQVLLASVRLRLFDLLAQGPCSADEAAATLGLEPDAARRLMAAAASLRLLEHCEGGRFGLGPLGAPMVGNDALAAMVEHHAALYADLSDPVALLKCRERAAAMRDWWPYAGTTDPAALEPWRVARYSALMSASLPMVADEVLDAYPFARHRRVLDVGGGEGEFVARLARREPALRLALFDLPAVAQRARERLAALGPDGARIEVHAGDFARDPLPRGADAATLVRVVHDHDDERALALLVAVREALEPGGVLVLAEQMAGTAGARAMGDAYFGMYLFAMGTGRPRTRRELCALALRAGFERVRAVPTRVPLQVSVLACTVPGPAQGAAQV